MPKLPGHLEAMRGVLASRYPDAKLTVLEGSAGERQRERLRGWLKEVVRLKKAKPFARALDRPLERSLQGPEPYQEASADALLSVMAEMGERVMVQISVSPVPHAFQDSVRGAAVQRRAPARESPPPDAVQPARGARLDRRGRLQAAELLRHPRSAPRPRARRARSSGRSRGTPREARTICASAARRLRRSLFIERMIRAESNPLPSWWRGVYSSLEIAALWQIPTAFAKNVSIERTNLPQLATPPEVFQPTEERMAIATDLLGNYIGIRSEDFKFGVQVSGVQGGGKTSILAKLAEVRAREPNTALIVLDPKEELDRGGGGADADLAHGARARRRQAALRHGAAHARARSAQGGGDLLRCDGRRLAHRAGREPGAERLPALVQNGSRGDAGARGGADVLAHPRWLAPDDDAAAWRAEKIAKLAGDPEWHGVWDHFARLLPAELTKSPAQTVMRLEAPYNKIQTLLGDDRLNTVLHHPVQVSFDEVIRRPRGADRLRQGPRPPRRQGAAEVLRAADPPRDPRPAEAARRPSGRGSR